MPRIRTVKPEFCTSDQLAECTRDARLLFILMWGHCDDAGIHPDSPKRLKMECFPADEDITSRDVDAWVLQLVENGLLRCYQVEDKRYLQVTGWHHQRIDRPNYRYPSIDRGTLVERSTNDQRAVVEQSSSDTGAVEAKAPPEGKGRDIGREKDTPCADEDAENATTPETTPESTPENTNRARRAKTQTRGARFEEFWNAYPAGRRRDKKKAAGTWSRKGLDEKADEILQDLELRPKFDRQWVRGYIPLPTTYLNGERWNDEYESADQTPAKPTGNGADSDDAPWQALKRHARAGHGMGQVAEDDPVLAEAVSNVFGSMAKPRAMTERDLEFKRWEFLKSYAACHQASEHA